MIRWHVVSDWTVCLRSNFKYRSTSSSVMYTLVQYTPIIHPFSHVEDDVLSASQRLIWSNFRCDGTRSVRTSEAVTLHFFFVKPAFRFSTWSRNWKRSIMLCIHHRRLAWYYTYYSSIRNSRQKAILDSYFQQCRFDFQSQVHDSRQTGMFSKWKHFCNFFC